jgi:hypothetical protein
MVRDTRVPRSTASKLCVYTHLLSMYLGRQLYPDLLGTRSLESNFDLFDLKCGVGTGCVVHSPALTG